MSSTTKSTKKNLSSLPRAAVALGLFSAVLLAATPADAQRGRDRFSDTTNVTVVEVPVQVIRNGEPVRGLTQDDFEILDGRKEQPIVGFDVVDLSTETGDVTEPVPVAARRHFLVLFDLYFSEPDSIGRARKEAADLVLNSLHPTDLVAVATYNNQPNLVLGFTSDRNQIRHAIQTLGVANQTQSESVRDPLGLVIGDVRSDISGDLILGDDGGTGGQVDADAIAAETRRDLSTMRSREARQEMASKVGALTSSMTGFARMMAGIQGNKYVVFMSEGFDSSVLVGNRGLTSEDQATLLENAQNAADGQTWKVDNEAIYGDTAAQGAMTRMLEEFNRANCTIQAVDVAGLVRGEAESKRDSLFMMAKDTGGEMYSNFTNLGTAMESVLDKTSVTYLLAFQPTLKANDEKYHKIRVRLKNGGGRGTDVVHRPGYYPPRGYANTNRFERVLGSAEQIVGGVAGGPVDVAVLAGGFDVPSEDSYVPVLVEIGGSTLAEGLEGSELPVEIYAYALDSDGTVRDFFVRKIGIDKNGAGPTFEKTGLKYWGHFDLEPGKYSVRVLVRNDATGRHGLATTEVTAPGPSAGPILLPAFFPEAPDRWVLLREEEKDQRQGVEFPFLRDGQPFIPSAVPPVAKGDTPISLVAYGLGAGSLNVDAQLFTDEGEAGGTAEVALADGAQGSDGRSQLSATFKPGKAKPGEYLLVVTVKNVTNGKEATSSIPIKVG